MGEKKALIAWTPGVYDLAETRPFRFRVNRTNTGRHTLEIEDACGDALSRLSMARDGHGQATWTYSQRVGKGHPRKRPTSESRVPAGLPASGSSTAAEAATASAEASETAASKTTAATAHAGAKQGAPEEGRATTAPSPSAAATADEINDRHHDQEKQ
jgi:hypothetical protein